MPLSYDAQTYLRKSGQNERSMSRACSKRKNGHMLGLIIVLTMIINHREGEEIDEGTSLASQHTTQ